MRLHLDLETRSTIDLRKVGADVYARHVTTEVILARYALGSGPVEEWRMGQPIPEDLELSLEDSGCTVVAHNFQFERSMLMHNLGPKHNWPVPSLARWDCTQARARACALPAGLDGATKVLGAPFPKDKEGHALMLRMCKPRKIYKPHLAESMAVTGDLQWTRLDDGCLVEWWADDERMDRLSAYCASDVEAERWLDNELPILSQYERRIFLADARLNERGVPLDEEFLEAAAAVAADAAARYDARICEVTGGAVPKATNVSKLVVWLLSRGVAVAAPVEDADGGAPEEEEEEDDAEGAETKKPDLPPLRKNDLLRLLASPEVQGADREAIQIRFEAGKSSVRKIQAMQRRLVNGRVRHMLAYHGASTGRWSAAGSGVQLQNLPREGVEDWNACRATLDHGAEAVDVIEGPPLDVLSKMLRGAIYAPEGKELIFVDLSQVEARGVAWLAEQEDLIEAFASGRDVYCEFGPKVFNRPISKADVFARWLSKKVVLGAGYGMGWVKFQLTCIAEGKDVDEGLAQRAISSYRDAYPQIPILWKSLENACRAAIQNPGSTFGVSKGRIKFKVAGRWLLMQLPSGRKLRYLDPFLVPQGDYAPEINYWGINSKSKQWGAQKTYGGRLTENAVQALCRDLIAQGLLDLEEEDYAPLLLVHDEAICEVAVGSGSVREMEAILCRQPAWAGGFPIAAEGKRARRYAK